MGRYGLSLGIFPGYKQATDKKVFHFYDSQRRVYIIFLLHYYFIKTSPAHGGLYQADNKRQAGIIESIIMMEQAFYY